MSDPITVSLTRRYRTPRYRYGQTVEDAIRGPVIITRTSDAPIPWPMGKLPGGRKAGLVVFKGLEIALRTESALAICHHWGVTTQTVSKWRGLLGIDQKTPGAKRLRRIKLTPILHENRHLIDYTNLERVQKIATARTGKPRPKHVQKLLRTANVGKTVSPSVRQKISDGVKRAGIRPPKAGRTWTVAEDQLIQSKPAAEVATLTGRTLSAVYSRRSTLGLPDGRRTITKVDRRETRQP